MIQKTDLLHVPVFADLPNDQIAWFLSQCQEQIVKPGDTYIHAGDPAENMFVILEGEFQARGEINGEAFAFPVKAGEVTGLLPFSRMKKTPVTGRAMTNGRLLRFSSSHFPELVQKMPEEATLSDILYELYVRHEIDEGLRDIDEGRTIPHEEAMKRIARWLS